MRTAIVESIHEIARRPQFAGAPSRVDGDRRITEAPCGCVNYTAVAVASVSACGTTWLCDSHAIWDEADED